MRYVIPCILETPTTATELLGKVTRPRPIDMKAYTQIERIALQNEFEYEPVDWEKLTEITEDLTGIGYDFASDVDELSATEPDEKIEGIEEVLDIQKDNERDREEGWPYSDDNDFPDHFR